MNVGRMLCSETEAVGCCSVKLLRFFLNAFTTFTLILYEHLCVFYIFITT